MIQFPYGIADFRRIRREGMVYVDRTAHIRDLETLGSVLVFLRPRRFGKSLWVQTLATYYDLRYADAFDELFERLLGRTVRELDAVDASGFKQAMRLRALRFECARVKKEVHAAAVTLRKALVELVGSKQCRFQFGLSLRTPRGAADLAIEMRRLVSRLADHGLRLPQSLLPGLEADPQGWVAELEPRVDWLGQR